MNNKGVTLIELIAILVVLGIIAAIAIPKVSDVIIEANKTKILTSAILIEDSAKTYCTTNSCEVDQVLTSTELSNYISMPDSAYTYNATVLSNGLIAVTLIKTGDYSFPYSSDGVELEIRVPSLSSNAEVNINDESDSEDNPNAPIIPDGEPYIILNGSSTVYVEIATSFDDPGAIAYTSEDIELSNVWQGGSVNYWILGTYTITYNAYSGFDNKNCIPAERTIIVVDTTAPVININGGSTVTRPVGTWYSENGAWATDNSGEAITVTTTGADLVDINTVGTYDVIYTSTDSSGNTTTVTKTVIIE